MTRLLRRTGSTASLDDTATQCAMGHARKHSHSDSASVSSDMTQSDRSLPPLHQLYESERSCCYDSVASVDSTSRRVDFGKVEVRQYEQVIGDHPHCSSGCPLSLGWDYVEEKPESLGEYEQHRQHVRKHDELRLSDEERYERLLANEVSDAEIRRCLRRLHRERECSVRCQMKAKAQFFF